MAGAGGPEVIELKFQPDPAGIAAAEVMMAGLAKVFQMRMSAALLGAAGTTVGGGGGGGGGGRGGGGGGSGGWSNNEPLGIGSQTTGAFGSVGGGLTGSYNAVGSSATGSYPSVAPPASAFASPMTPVVPGTMSSGALMMGMGNAISNGIGSSLAGTDTALVGSPGILGVKAALGAGQGFSSFLGNIPGIGGALAGAGELGLKAFERGIFSPIEQAAGEVSGIVGQMSRYGFEVSDEDISSFAQERLVAARRQFKASRRATRLTYEAGIIGSAQYSLSALGI